MVKIMSVTDLRKNIFDVIEATRVNKQITQIMLHGEVVAEIRHKKTVKKKNIDFVDLVKSFSKEKPMSVGEMDLVYRKEMIKKHGKYISGRK